VRTFPPGAPVKVEPVVERAVARVELGAVERNCARLRSLLAPGAALCAVVKADAYGHGALAAASAAVRGGATRLAVATAREAATLRAGGIDAPILVMGALTAPDAALAVATDADVVVWREPFAAALATRADPDRPLRVHVKYDTGMGRLGTADLHELRAVVSAVDAAPELELAGLMTHFATADARGDDHFSVQLERFDPVARELKSSHPEIVVHAANSAATIRAQASHYDMVRCGVAIYGLDPFGVDPADEGLEPALSLHSYVAAVKRFEPGDGAGYGQTWRAREPTWVATLPIGYGDGWRRALSNDCDVLIGGRRHPLVGTVSMDNVTVALGPGASVETGVPAVLIGAQGDERITAEEVAGRLGTINYEVTCGLLPRVRRVHLEAG
jgi:alanine racemase